jgi:hypothetical protein
MFKVINQAAYQSSQIFLHGLMKILNMVKEKKKRYSMMDIYTFTN